jgi:hypothetical protein
MRAAHRIGVPQLHFNALDVVFHGIRFASTVATPTRVTA